MCDFRYIIIVAVISALSQITVQHRLRCGGFDCKDHEQCTIQLHGSNYFENCTEKCEHLGHCEPHHISDGHTCCCPDPHCLDSARREAEKHHGLICGHVICHGHDKCMVSNRGQTKTCSRKCEELDDCEPHRVRDGHRCCCYDRHCLDKIHIEHAPAPEEHLTCPHCENYPHDCQDPAQPCPADHACVFIKEHDHRIHSECKPRHECDVNHEVIQCCRTQDCVNNYGHTTPTTPTTPTSPTTPATTTTPQATTTVDHRVPCQICSDLLNHNCSNTNAYCDGGRKCLIHLHVHTGIISTWCIRQHAPPCTTSAGENYMCCSDMDCFNQTVNKFNSIFLNAKLSSSPSSTTNLSPTSTSAISTLHFIPCSECSDFQSNICTQTFVSCKTGESCLVRSNHNIISTKCIKETDCHSLKQLDVKSGGNTSSTCCLDANCYIGALVSKTSPVPAISHTTPSLSTTKISTTSHAPSLNHTTPSHSTSKISQTSSAPALNHSTSSQSTTKIWLTVFNDCKDRDESQMTCQMMDHDFHLCSSPNTVALALFKCRKYCGLCHYSTTPPIKTTQQPATVVMIG